MRMFKPLDWQAACLVLVLLAGAGQEAAAGTAVQTNESYLEDTRRQPEFDINDKQAVFRLVLGSLPAKVKVLPTENYYYFSFHYRGIKYAGNIRFDAEDRDEGLIHFNYFKDFTSWQRDEGGFSAVLGSRDGVEVKAAGKLAYEVAFAGKRVLFELNDLSGVKPPDGAVAQGEIYIGPVFDESGIRFFLVFNEGLKTFLYVLDESPPASDQYNISSVSDRITIGIRSGFAFYADRFANRKLLIGVNQINTSVNNYLDGPFDQLPDNFIVGDTLKRAILAASPEMEGQIDRFGNSPDGETRYLIAPYLQYEDESDLGIIAQCAAGEELPVYYNCFSYVGADEGEDGDPSLEHPPPQ